MIAIYDFFRRSIPSAPLSSLSEWGRRHVRLPISAQSDAFDPDIAPWIREPLEKLGDPATRVVTFVKPIQSGGSTVGEVALCHGIATFSRGDIQYNWEDDIKAGERWDKRIEKILRACPEVMQRWPLDKNKAKRGLVIFSHLNLTVQGTWDEDNLSSDSVRFQINEEIHAWDPGRLRQAYGRTTAYWNATILNISNASNKDDQLHAAFKSGTQQHWEVKCPGCGAYHRMRIKWEDEHPELGGLRYESSRSDNGEYDYPAITKTVRYQMPCGHCVRDDETERRALSMSGRYGAPENPGAVEGNFSYTLSAVAVDYIPWILLIEEKHLALAALAAGDPEPYEIFIKERECMFWHAEDRPIYGAVVTTAKLKKSRDGLVDRAARFFSLDRQQGSLKKGEMPHWWLLIRDARRNGDSRLVWEGKCLTDDEAIGTLKDHACKMRCGVADSGDDTMHVYQFCLHHGINAVKGDDAQFFHHDNGTKPATRRIYSTERPLHSMVNAPSKFPYRMVRAGNEVRQVPNDDEPLFWFYSKPGVLNRLAWLRDQGMTADVAKELGVHKPAWEVPDDVSADYKRHMGAWKLTEQKVGRSKEVVNTWQQVFARDDLHWCERMIAMLMEMAGFIGEKR